MPPYGAWYQEVQKNTLNRTKIDFINKTIRPRRTNPNNTPKKGDYHSHFRPNARILKKEESKQATQNRLEP